MILAVDAGNSRIKWALHEHDAFAHEGSVALADLRRLERDWAPLPAADAIVVANVAGEAVRADLQKLFARWKAEPRWVAASGAQCGVVSRYDDPSQLGADRWAALIGARWLVSGCCLVVNAGTAMTVDALSAQGEFIGGIIVPGFDLMHEALASNTAGLSSERGSFAPFPRSTRDAITSGAIQALCGAVERVRAAMVADGYGEPTLLVGGGAAEMVAQRLGRPVRIADKLVLEGLVRIAQEQR
ncbi:MAG: type III pantothenate kinase [Betaproteobacteria bacterium]